MSDSILTEWFGHADLSSSLDSDDSAGAQWLTSLANASTEAWEYGRFAYTDEDKGDTGEYENDVITELANAAVPVYTHQRWLTFVDVCAYQSEAADELIGAVADEDMTGQAGAILCRMGESAIASWLSDKRASIEAQHDDGNHDECHPDAECRRAHVDYPHDWGRLPGCWCEDEEEPEA